MNVNMAALSPPSSRRSSYESTGFFVLSHLTGDRQQSPVSRALKVNAILAVCVKRSLTKRRAHAVVFVEMHNPYHFIFFKAFQRIAQPERTPRGRSHCVISPLTMTVTFSPSRVKTFSFAPQSHFAPRRGSRPHFQKYAHAYRRTGQFLPYRFPGANNIA